MAGAIVGGIIGSAIGEYLDEVDQLKADMAALTALKASDLKPVKWTSKDNANVSGEAMVVSKNKPGNCKTVKHILNINGKEVFEEQQYCLESDGSWVLQS
jgi:surface antigen